MSRGWCRKHYTRWWRHGDPRRVLTPWAARLTVLLLLLAGCAPLRRLPREDTTPPMAGFIVSGAAVDAGLQGVQFPAVLRVVTVVTFAGIVRYSTCCQRPEAGHLGFAWGSAFAELVGLALRVMR